MATRLCGGKAPFNAQPTWHPLIQRVVRGPALCIIHVRHKELRTMTVRDDGERHVGMGFFF